MRRYNLVSLILMLPLAFLFNTHFAKCGIITSSIHPTGLVTARLSAKELEKWKAIEQVVFAEDTKHQLLHPTLVGLWQWVETSGHTLYVEFSRPANTSTCTAGHFMIEQFDPSGEHQVAVIQLNLQNINQAYVGSETKRADGLIPFLGLDREERYAEVLGHELAHAVHVLTNLPRSQMVEELVQQTNQILLSHHRLPKAGGIPQDLNRRLSKRDVFLRQLEQQAEKMELIVWEELTAHKFEKE